MTTSFHFEVEPSAVGDSGQTRDDTFAPIAPREPPKDFREHFRALSPLFLLGPVGRRLTGALGLVWDAVADGARYATLARHMLGAAYPADALALTGTERLLPRLLGESDRTYFARVYDAWRVWSRAGTDAALVDAFEAAGWTIELLYAASWDFDGRADDWSRVFIVLSGHGWKSAGKWGDRRVLGSGATWGSTAPQCAVRQARQLARAFKPGHVRVGAILVLLGDDPSLDASGAWGDFHNRPAGIAFWDG